MEQLLKKVAALALRHESLLKTLMVKVIKLSSDCSDSEGSFKLHWSLYTRAVIVELFPFDHPFSLPSTSAQELADETDSETASEAEEDVHEEVQSLRLENDALRLVVSSGLGFAIPDTAEEAGRSITLQTATVQQHAQFQGQDVCQCW